jgi:hypothetical protein
MMPNWIKKTVGFLLLFSALIITTFKGVTDIF